KRNTSLIGNKLARLDQSRIGGGEIRVVVGFDQADGQLAGIAMEIRLGIKSNAGIRIQDKCSVGAQANRLPGCAIQRVLPFALRCYGLIPYTYYPPERVRSAGSIVRALIIVAVIQSR